MSILKQRYRGRYIKKVYSIRSKALKPGKHGYIQGICIRNSTFIEVIKTETGTCHDTIFPSFNLFTYEIKSLGKNHIVEAYLFSCGCR